MQTDWKVQNWKRQKKIWKKDLNKKQSNQDQKKWVKTITNIQYATYVHKDLMQFCSILLWFIVAYNYIHKMNDIFLTENCWRLLNNIIQNKINGKW